MPPSKKGSSLQKKKSDAYTLDYDVPYVEADDDEFNVLHNRQRSKRARSGINRGEDFDGDAEGFGANDDDELDVNVLPSEAHGKRDQAILEKPHRRKPKKVKGGKGDDIDNAFTLEEEQEMADAAIRQQKKDMMTDHFAIAGINPANVVGVTQAGHVLLPEGQQPAMDAVVETVAADFAALTESQRLELIQAESPEVVKLAQDFRSNLEECRTLIPPLKKLLFNTRAREKGTNDHEVIAFLETKVQIMLAYCVHIAFFLCLKVEGQLLAEHPVCERLVELRVFLEKMWPVEQKLQYSINKLLVAAGAEMGDQTDATHPKQKQVLESEKALEGISKVTNLRPMKSNAPLVQRTIEMDELRDRRRAEKAALDAQLLEAEEESMMTRSRVKKTADDAVAKGLNAPLVLRAVDEGFRDQEDAFLTKTFARRRAAVADDQAEVPLGGARATLMSKLRAKLSEEKKFEEARRANAKQDRDDLKKENLSKRAPPQYFAPGEISSDEDEDEAMGQMYDSLVVEENARTEKAQVVHSDAYDEHAPSKGDTRRRKINKEIKMHHGLTKNRNADRKNPRVNRRMKYQAAERKHLSQVKSVKHEGDNFNGVSRLRTDITRSNKIM